MAQLAVIVCTAWVVVAVSLTLYWGVCLLRNYAAARKLGVPLRVIPIDHTNPIWMLLDRKILSIITQLVPSLRSSSFVRHNYRGWELRERYFSHHELGDVFALVTPGRTWVYIANPDALMDVFRRRTDFPRCLELTGKNSSCSITSVILGDYRKTN
jgi:hypothetical protein